MRGEFLSDKEKEVFDQEVEKEELSEVNGGKLFGHNCDKTHHRDIYGGKGFPNCAATVEDGSWCGSGDACEMVAIVYDDIEGCLANDCEKAWR